MANFFHKLADAVRAAAGKQTSPHATDAVIVAAGSSLRMGGGVSKQMLPLCGIPVVVHTLLAFEASDCIDRIVVVARKEELPLYRGFKETYHLDKLAAVVSGGDTRQESVLRGLSRVSDKAKFVAVSDAARCLVTAEQIDKVCHAAYETGAAIAATPATDTVKIKDKKGFLTTTDRGSVWLASTPQVFRANLYRAAAYTARDKGITATDDASLVELLPYAVRPVDVGHLNLKLTTPEDVPVMESILLGRMKAKEKETSV